MLEREDVLWLCSQCKQTLAISTRDTDCIKQMNETTTNLKAEVDTRFKTLEQKFDILVDNINSSISTLKNENEKQSNAMISQVSAHCKKTFSETIMGSIQTTNVTADIIENEGVSGVMNGMTKEAIIEQFQELNKEDRIKEERE